MMMTNMNRLFLPVFLAGVLNGLAAQPAQQVKTNAAPAPVVDVLPRQRQEIKAEQRRPEPLDKEKQEKMLEAGKQMRQEQTVVYEAMRKLRVEIEALCKASPIDEKAIRAKASELGKLEGDVAMIRAKHYQEISKIVPKEQLERLQQVPPELRGPNTNQALRMQSIRTNQGPVIRPAAPQSAQPARTNAAPPKP